MTKTIGLRYETEDMVKLHHYSKEKYLAFSDEKQVKAILELLTVLELNIADPEYRQALIASIVECCSWSSEDVKKQFPKLDYLSQLISPHDILRLITPLIRAGKHNFNENDSGILRFDGSRDKAELLVPFPVTVILDNLRSAYNVGSIFRTAECVKAEQIFLCGITPAPPHPRLAKTAMGTEQRLPWKYFSDTEEAIRVLKKTNLPVIALETTSTAKSIYEYKPEGPVAMIMGNEALGIEEKILTLADEVLYIPVHGWKNSLNVSNAFTLAAYWLSGIPLK